MSIPSNEARHEHGIGARSYSARKLQHLPLFLQRQQPEFEKIFEVVDAMPLDDTHCHLVTDRDAVTSPKRFLDRISLAGYPVPFYFLEGVYERWLNGDEVTKHALDRQYDIQSKVDDMTYHLAERVHQVSHQGVGAIFWL